MTTKPSYDPNKEVKGENATISPKVDTPKDIPPERADPRGGERRLRHITTIKAEKYWVDKARVDPSFFIEYLIEKPPARHHKLWLANIFHPDRKRLNFIAPRDSAKAQPLTSQVLTPEGFVDMGSLTVGDKVISGKGTETRILAIQPRGRQEIYKVTFTDGSVTRCTADHLWKVWLLGVDSEYDVLPLSDIHAGDQVRYQIPVVEPILFSEKEFPLDPYLLGVYLGGGIRNLNTFKTPLKALGLYRKKSEEKFIPECYFQGSVKQRLYLLQGLLDAGGIVKVVQRLHGDTIRLVRSLGGTASHNPYPPEGSRLAQRVHMNLPPGLSPFNPPFQGSKFVPEREITTIEKDGYEEAQCIVVDHPDHTYVTDEYIVTHNSTYAVYSLAWFMGKEPLKTNGIISVSSTQAEDRLRMLKSIVSENTRYRNVFPHINVDKRQPMTQKEFSLVSRENNMSYAVWRSRVERLGSLKDPSVFVAGAGGKGIIGRRISGMMLLDDIIDETMLKDTAQVKVLQYIIQTLIPCVGEDGKVINIGTRWMIGDVPEMLRDNPAWHTIEISAIRYDQQGEAHSYWEDYWPLKKLYAKKAEMNNDALFSVMYLSDPKAMAAHLFTSEVLSHNIPEPPPKFVHIFITTDQALSLADYADWNVYITVGIDEADNYYILDLVRFRGDPEYQLQSLWKAVDKAAAIYGRFDELLFEKAGYQAFAAGVLAMQRPDIPIAVVTPLGNKGHRANLVSQVAHAGKLFIRQSMLEIEQLKKEWIHFPNHRHDDTLDPMGLLLQHRAQGVAVSSVEFVKGGFLL